MLETFLGDLAEVKLFDILKPLFSDKKTGKVIFKGKEGGELYLELGNITHAKTDNSVGEFAFFTLMGLSAGKASFMPDEVPSERTISISTEQLILNWSSQKQWNKIKEVIPSANSIFRALPQKNPESISLTGEQWNVSALCNGRKPSQRLVKLSSGMNSRHSRQSSNSSSWACWRGRKTGSPLRKSSFRMGFSTRSKPN